MSRQSRPHRMMISLGLAGLIFSSWIVAHVTTIFFFDWQTMPFTAVVMVVALCWLYVGLFIIAHDCMHGSVAPGYPSVNRGVGTLALIIYGGFSFDRLNAAHHDHHKFAGTAGDPDFDDRHPHGFWPWYIKFFSEYFSWRQPVVIGTMLTVYYFLFGANITNLFLFIAIPALLSSLQLFTFGTYLPHVPHEEGHFQDTHQARSVNFGWLLSLLTCYHFGYHHEHHLRPKEPWWRLPSTRRSIATQASSSVN